MPVFSGNRAIHRHGFQWREQQLGLLKGGALDDDDIHLALTRSGINTVMLPRDLLTTGSAVGWIAGSLPAVKAVHAPPADIASGSLPTRPTGNRSRPTLIKPWRQ